MCEGRENEEGGKGSQRGEVAVVAETLLSGPDQGAATLWTLVAFTGLTKSPQDVGLGKCSAE